MPASLRAHASRATSSRPYDRRSPAASPAQSETPYLPQSAPPPPSPVQAIKADATANVPPDRPGLPTYAEYKQIEAAYLHSLSPRKRDKALITQAMFDKIWEVLHQPEACTIGTPQFRFWVRKMFTLSQHVGVDGTLGWIGGESGTGIAGDSLQGEGSNADSQGERSFGAGIGSPAADEFEFTEVVLHENRPVAIMEQLYELFCYCHVRSGHGGRDKTCAVIREHYSWVPKELTAQFVKACPTCFVKRSGYTGGVVVGVDIKMVAQRRVLGSGKRKGRAALSELEAEETSVQPVASPGQGWPTTGGPLAGNPEPCGVRERERERERLRTREDVGSACSPSPVTPASARGPPTPTEVPLRLDGCPVGGWSTVLGAWTDLPASPFHACEATRSLGCPVSTKSVREEKENRSPTKTLGPSPTSVLSNDSLEEYVNLTGPEPGDAVECLFPPALRPLRLLGPPASDAESDLAGPGPFQIDPVLLSFNYPGLGLSCDPTFNASGAPEVDAVSLGLREDALFDTYGTADRASGPGLFRLCGFPSDVSVDFKPVLLPPPNGLDSPELNLSSEGKVTSAAAEGIATLQFSLSTESMMRSRYGSRYGYRDGPLYPCSADEVGPFSFPIVTDA